jgi:hypothetical protein
MIAFIGTTITIATDYNSSRLGIARKTETTRRQIPGSKIPKDITYSSSYSICLLLDPFGVSRLFVPRRSKQETLYQGDESLIINSSKCAITLNGKILIIFQSVFMLSPRQLKLTTATL